MIYFKRISWINFLSTGNAWTSIDLDKHRSTLIVGENGAGKSTMLDALSFALFSKPHRNIKKPQLVNTINEKAMEVQVEFSIGSYDFVVVRGMKPNKFEIWQNGTMINQSSTTRDYQKYLEQTILKLNHKSFHQIVVLGSSSYIPFMQLPQGQRREVIEDLLDIQIFSRMNAILKEQLSSLKDEIKDVDYNIDLTKEKIQLQDRYIREIEEINEQQIQQKLAQIQSYNDHIQELQDRNSQLTEFVQSCNDGLDGQILKLSNKREKLMKYEAQFKQQVSSIVKEAKFYEENDTCPTCTQEIDSSLKETKVNECKSKAGELKTALNDAGAKKQSVEATLNELQETSREITEANSEIHSNNQQITQSRKSVNSLEEDINELSSREGDLGTAKSELDTLKETKSSLTEHKLQLLSSQTYKQAAAEMLKDTGIKTKVIKEYLPAMNQLINKYLQILDFFVSFHLDESFNETIKSRYRDAFSYASFSEGEKSRIDISLLMAWRQIGKMKNSTSTNLLVMDEIMDGSTDDEGLENLMKILDSLDDDTNTFVISHKSDQMDGKFTHKLKFKKEHNFSQLEVDD